MGSRDTLVDDLLAQPPTSARDELVIKAIEGRYHDYRSSHPTPKIALVGDLTHCGYRDLARKARSGAYDDPPDDDDNANIDEWLKGEPALAELDRKFRAGEITYQDVIVAAMQTLSPEDRVRAAVEIDITSSAKARFKGE